VESKSVVSGRLVNFSRGAKILLLSTISRKLSTGKIPLNGFTLGVFGFIHKMHSTTTKTYFLRDNLYGNFYQ
jgi:hypothetical protein